MAIENSFFYHELQEQPKALRTLVSQYLKNDVKAIKQIGDSLAKHNPIFFTGMGTSYFAPLFIRHKLSRTNDLFIIDTGELLHYNYSSIANHKLITVISQSGESIEIAKLVKKIRHKSKIVSITNNSNSTLALNSNFQLQLHAGKEKSISNKTYTNTLAILLILADCIDGRDIKTTCKDLMNISFLMEDYFVKSKNIGMINEIASFLHPVEMLHFIGRGPNLVSAYQAALIFMEGAKCNAQGFSAGQFRHGPIETSSKDHKAIVFAPEGPTYNINISLCEDLLKHDSKVVFLTNNSCNLNHKNLVVQQLDAPSEESFAFVAAIVFELLLICVAKNRGFNAGVFNIAKKVTDKE